MIGLIIGALFFIVGTIAFFGGLLFYIQAKKKYLFSGRSFMISFGINVHTNSVFEYFNASSSEIWKKLQRSSPDNISCTTEALLNVGFDGGEIMGLAALGLNELVRVNVEKPRG